MTGMGSNEIWAKCQQCGTELKQGDKVCPKCGSAKHVERTGLAVVGLKVSAKAKHVAHFGSKELAILGIIVAIVSPLVTLALPSPPYVIRIAIIIAILIIVLVLIFNNKMRYSLIMLLRQLDQKLAARKTYGNKKKPS